MVFFLRKNRDQGSEIRDQKKLTGVMRQAKEQLSKPDQRVPIPGIKA
jgi:hypothetical protein